MSINKQQMIVSKLIDEIMIAALGNVVVFILMVAILNGSPLALLSAMVGVGFAGRLVTRPSARPPRWTPTVAGLDADYAQEEEVREWVRTAERPNGLPII